MSFQKCSNTQVYTRSVAHFIQWPVTVTSGENTEVGKQEGNNHKLAGCHVVTQFWYQNVIRINSQFPLGLLLHTCWSTGVHLLDCKWGEQCEGVFVVMTVVICELSSSVTSSGTEQNPLWLCPQLSSAEKWHNVHLKRMYLFHFLQKSHAICLFLSEKSKKRNAICNNWQRNSICCTLRIL